MVELAERAEAQSGGNSRVQDVDRHVGARLRERRIMLRLTQQQMAELIGVTGGQVLKYEMGINRIASGRLYNIARVLGVDVGYFFEGLHGSGNAFVATPQQRRLLELARNFIAIPEREQQDEVFKLTRALSEPWTDRAPSSAPVKFVKKLMETWAIDSRETAVLLGFEQDKDLLRILSGATELDRRDIKDRVRHLLRTREALHSLFRDLSTEREWLREPRSELSDQSPLDLLLEGSMENLLVVSQFVQRMVGR